MTVLDNKDYKILDILKRDARTPYKKIAEHLKVSEGTIFNRIDRLKKAGILRGFHADINFEKIGYELTAIVGILAQGPNLVKLEEKISNMRDIVAVYDIAGEYDALLIAKFKSRNDLDAFVKRLGQIPEIERTYTYMVLNTRKEDFNAVQI